MHPASAKTGCFADRMQARDDVTFGAEHPPVQIGFEAAESLTCQKMEPNSNERPVPAVEQTIRLGGSEESIPDVSPGCVDGHELAVLSEAVC